MGFKKAMMRVVVLSGVIMIAQPGYSYVVPINSSKENGWPNMDLLIESEITRWKQEALKYQEMIYTDMVGKVGGGSLGKNNVITQMQKAAGDGARVIENTTAQLQHISDLGNYATAKEQIEKYYMINPESGQFYSTQAVQRVSELQKAALNDLTVAAMTQAAADTVGSIISTADSEPELRAKDIAKAKDMNAMMEMLLGMDRKVYERSLQISALEAADAGVQAMSVLKGLSETARHTSGKVSK